MRLKLRSGRTGRQPRFRELDSEDTARTQPSVNLSYGRARRREFTSEPKRRAALVDMPFKDIVRQWLQRAGLVLLMTAAFVSAVNVLSLSANPKVELVTGSKNDSILQSNTIYEAAATQEFKSSIWNRNKITLDTGKVTKGLLNRFPELSNVSIAVPLLAHRPVVYLQPARPVLVMTAINGSYAIDANGKALLNTAAISEHEQIDKLPAITDESGLRVKLNQQALPAKSVQFIQTVAGQLATKSYNITDMKLPVGTNELDVHLAGQGYFIKFNLQNDTARQQAGTFLALIAELHRRHITPANYIDVRVDGRAYYK